LDEPTTQEGSGEVDLSDLEMLASLSLDGPIDISTSGGALMVCC
jgi:hypothetical protein